MAPAGRTRTVALGYTTVFFDVLGFSIVVPTLPYISSSLGASAFQEGLLFSGYCFTQLFSLLIMGSLSDIYGRKLFFVLSLAGSCFGAIFQGLSKTIEWLIFWRCATGLFAGSPIVTQALIADVTTVEERNRFLTILEAVISSAFILGPALGGYIGSFDYMYPLYFSGAIAGIAMLCAIFLMEETNKDVRQIYQWRAEKKGKSEEEKKAVDLRIKEKYAAIRKTRDDINVKPTKLMVLCFIFEFFNRWVIQAIDSRYGYYMKDLYGFTSTMYSTLACIQSIWNCFQQGFLYGQITGKLKVPIPYLALFGVSLQCVAYFLMGWSPNVVVTILGSFLLWMGYGFASPASMSIISTTNAPEVQGKVLSWNNMCQQVSLIVSPLVLSSIYAENKHATYYSSILMSFIAVIVMLIIISMPNSRLFGKSDMKELPVTKPAQSNEVEMVKTEASPSPEKKEEEEVEVKKKGEEEKKVEKMEEEKKEEVEGNGESVEITIETPATNSI